MARIVAQIGCSICAVLVFAIVLSVTENPGLWAAVFLIAMIPYLVVAMRLNRAGTIESYGLLAIVALGTIADIYVLAQYANGWPVLQPMMGIAILQAILVLLLVGASWIFEHMRKWT